MNFQSILEIWQRLVLDLRVIELLHVALVMIGRHPFLAVLRHQLEQLDVHVSALLIRLVEHEQLGPQVLPHLQRLGPSCLQ